MADEFDEQFQAGVELAFKRAKTAQRKIAFEVFKGVIMMTPVDTGHARANWQPSIGEPARGPIDAQDKSGDLALGAIASVTAEWTGEGDAILCNNLPYIEALENGHSQQAPAGMIGMTIARFERTAHEVGVRVKAGEL